MRTLYLDIERPMDTRLLDPSNSEKVGGPVLTINTSFTKPMREFTIRSWNTLLKDQMEIIRNEVHAGRISGVFWFDGEAYGDITEPIYIGDGNNSQTEFPMPFDNVFAPSWEIKVNNVLNTGWTMYEQSGVLVFTSAPTGRITGTGKRKFRVVMTPNSDSLLGESQLYSRSDDGVYTMQPITLTEVQAVNIV